MLIKTCLNVRNFEYKSIENGFKWQILRIVKLASPPAPPTLTCTPRGRCWAGWPGGGSSCRPGSARRSGRSRWVCRAAPAAGHGGRRSSLPQRDARTSAPRSPLAGPGKTGLWWSSCALVPLRPASPPAAQPGAAGAERRGYEAASPCAIRGGAVKTCPLEEKVVSPALTSSLSNCDT